MNCDKNNKIKILIVDDHPLLRMGLKDVIESEADFKVCGEAESANKALKIISNTNPDFVTVDITLDGDINGIELVKAIKKRYPEIYTLVLSMYEETLYAERAIKAGARGYIKKKDAGKNIIIAIRKILDGELYLNETISNKIIDKLLNISSNAIGSPVDVLTDREFEVFSYMGNGLSTREIAKKLNISISTVETHRMHIRDKMKLKTSAELIKEAVQWRFTLNE